MVTGLAVAVAAPVVPVPAVTAAGTIACSPGPPKGHRSEIGRVAQDWLSQLSSIACRAKQPEPHLLGCLQKILLTLRK